MIKKSIMFIFLILISVGCSFAEYTYISDNKVNRLSITGYLKDEDTEYSPLDTIVIRDERGNNKVELVGKNIKIVKEGKEYTIPYEKTTYNALYIYIEKNGVNITDGDFIAYIGKVKLDTGEIVNIPPLHFKKNIYIEKHGMLAGFASVGRFESYSGTVEEYKKNGWK